MTTTFRVWCNEMCCLFTTRMRHRAGLACAVASAGLMTSALDVHTRRPKEILRNLARAVFVAGRRTVRQILAGRTVHSTCHGLFPSRFAPRSTYYR